VGECMHASHSQRVHTMCWRCYAIHAEGPLLPPMQSRELTNADKSTSDGAKVLKQYLDDGEDIDGDDAVSLLPF
jgi:hypothetical protein